MNLVLGVIPKKISNRIFLLLAAVILTGGFFAVSYVLAAHTPTVTVSPLTIKGGASSAYTFSVDNAGANFIYYIKITAPLGFTVNNNLICPADWTSASSGIDITCTGDPDPGIGLGIQPGAGTTVSFTALAPSSDSTNPWVVQTKDNAFASVISNPVTLVDATVPAVQSITTKDTDGDGRVETATIVFSEPVDDSTFESADFTIDGTEATDINSETANDNTFNISVDGGVAGTEAKDITYTQGTGADLVGNLLSNIVTGTIVEVDDADPVFMSAQTTATNKIELTFSENLNGSTVTNADFSVAGYSLTAPDATELNGVVTLTTSSNFGTGDKPAVTYNITASNGVKDSNDNQAPAVGPITPADNVAPIIAATRTLTTTSIEITFSEAMSAVNKADFAVAGNTINSVTFTAGQTTAILVLQNTIGTGDTPQVSTVALPTNTKDNAISPNTITGSLISTPVDDIAPTVIITATTAASPTKIAPIGMTITFSENVTGFIIDDLVVGNGTAGNFSGAGAVYNFDITSPGQGAVTVNIAGAVAKDAADNDNAAAAQFSIIYDSFAPTVSIVLADPALKVGETSLVTFTFSEPVTDFTNADITTIDNGILTGVSSTDGGTTWTATFTPTDGITDNTNIITVNKTGVADLAGNAGVGSTSSDNNYAIDTVRPTVTVELANSNLIAGETTTVTFTFSEAPTDFTAADVTVGSGSIGAVSATGSPLVFTATLTPTVDTEEATNIITVGTGWTDAAGNAPADSTDSANYIVETKKPTVSLASATANPTNGLIAVTAEFSEDVFGFDATDITVGNGAAEDFITVDGNSYTFNVNPTDGANFAVTIDVLANKATDAAGNNNTASNQLTYISDTVAPAAPAITSIAGDNFINDSEKTAVHVVGMAEAGSTVSVTLTGGATVGPITGVASQAGAFDITLNATTLTDGTITPSVTATDVAGNTSAADTDPTALKDTAAPSAPATPDLTAATDSNINTDDITNDATPDFITTAEIGSTIAVYDGATLVGAMTATGGADTITVLTLSNGVHGITVKTTDAAGNESPASSALAVTVDTAAPTAVFSAATDDVGLVTGALINGQTTDDTALVLSGTNESGSTVEVFNGAGSLGQAVISGDAWSYAATVADGTTYQFNVKETDVAGNASSATSNFTVIGDTTAPAAPVITSIAGDNFINDSEKAAVHVIGTAEAGSTVSVTLTGGITVGPVAGTANGGVFDITLDATTLTDGIVTPSVTATDAAGNTSAADTDPTATKDTAAPTITSITSDATAAGILKVGDTITFTLTPGAAEVGANVLGSYNGVALAWSPNGGSTAFTATYIVAEGNTNQTSALQISGVTITDAFSNTSSTGAGTDVVKTIDAHTPTAPTTVTLLDPINNANKTAVTLYIIGESGTTYNYSIEDATPGSPVSSSGTLTGGDLTVSGIDVSSLDNGTLTASVTLTDAAGNISSASADTATKDASVPSAPVISSIAGDEKINNAEKAAIVVAGTAEADSLVSVTLSDGANSVTETQQLTGGATAFSITINGISLTDGIVTPSVTATDAAGNTSAADTDPTALKDTVAPVISINDGASASWTQTDTINLTVTETNPSTSKYGFSPDSACNASDTISTNFTSGAGFNITGDLTNYLCAKAADTAGNETYQLIGQLNTDNTVPDLTLNSMFTGQTLTGGNVYPISWTASDLHLSDTPVKLEYSVNGGTSWTMIAEATANDGSENWTVPSVNTSNGLIRTTVTDLATNASQADSDTFSITYSIVTDSTAPVATLNSPNGGETWENNAAHLITWTATDNITAAASLDIKLEYSTDGGTIWTTIIADTENDGAYSWTPTGLSSANVLVKVTATDAASLTGSDISNTVLTIATPVAYPESICTGSGPYTCTIALSSGWNLISFPIIPTDTAIATVLTGVSGIGTTTMVKYYDSTDPDDWKSYVPGSGGDLTTMSDGKGYWVNMTNSATLTVTGTSAPTAPNPPSTYDVITGWNLIGYKSLTAYQNASAYLSSIPSGYIVFDQNNTNKTSSYLQHGKGYWLWSTGAGSIVAGD